MTVINKESIRKVVSPDWLGAQRYVYSSYLSTSTDVIAADYFDDSPFDHAPRDLMWCKLQDGYFTLRFTSPTTAEIATD